MAQTRQGDRAPVAILGASGYTGAETIRLLAHHPRVRLTTLTADRKAGGTIGQVFPHLGGLDLAPLVSLESIEWPALDAAVLFCALPHGTTQQVVAAALEARPDLVVVDLSADFRLADVESYREWYGEGHHAPHLQTEAVYGLTEFARDAVAKARLIANPGCYPTTAQLPLIPLIEAGLIDADDIVIDSKSGVSGAGRAAKEQNLFTEVSEAIHAYGVGRHRHMPEIEQGLSIAAKRPVHVSFTPHLVPMNRGILSTIYVKLSEGVIVDDLRERLSRRFEAEPFVRVLEKGAEPGTRHVRGSNHCLISVAPDRRKGRAIILSVIDNLVKGAAGQAVQNMNVRMGWDETTGLEQEALFP
jgi:N-acetyl-gamma-glutamyl-phosphate reductase